MEYTADQQVFRFRKLFDNAGIINTNCVVEVLGTHFVFGPEDIYSNDGISNQSIIYGKNKEYLFTNLNHAQVDKFFTVHNPKHDEILFCYVSGDAQCNFTNTTYCNKAAVFNYKNATWTFRDLPNASGASPVAISYSNLTYASTAAAYSTIGGTYYSLQDNSFRNVYFTSPIDTLDGLAASYVYGYDTIYQGTLSQMISTTATKDAWAERIGIDLDETGEQLRAYKAIKTIYPQANALGGTGNIQFAFGSTTSVDAVPVFGSLQTFDPTTQEKVDVARVGGRYLGWRVVCSGSFDFELSGFDVDVSTTGRR